jgi:integrase
MARKGDGLYLRSRTWWLDFTHEGQRHQRRLGKMISRKIAAEIAQVRRGEILRGEAGIGRKKKDLSFAEARTRFTAWAEITKKAGTVREYKNCLKRLAESFGGTPLSRISPITVEGHKHSRKTAPIRANREVALLKGLFNYCIEKGLFEGQNPCTSVKFFPEPREKDCVLDLEQEDRLLAECAEPLKTMVLVGLHTGLRMRSEILTLKWECVDLRQKTLTVTAAYAKNGKVRVTALNSTVLAALTQLPKRGEFVFVKPSGDPYTSVRGFRSASQRAGLTKVTPHVLRHTFASRLMSSGVDVTMITKLGGWSSVKLLDRYCHANPSRMAEAVEKIARHSPMLVTTPDIRRIGDTA